MEERPRCAGCDAEFNAVCKPSTILVWVAIPGGAAVRFCNLCEEEVIFFSPSRNRNKTITPLGDCVLP